uniref:Putative Erf family protein n=1 Tax=viral metagenome TaxID=1070528 RepID=A0A6H1ZTR6_9ZZZZ
MEEQKPYDVTTRVPETAEGSPAALMLKAVAGGMDLDKLERFMALQEKWEANQARKAYTQAMAAFKSEPLTVIKDKVNMQYKSKYSSEDSLLNTVNPILSRHGLSAGFDFDQTNGLKITCILTHAEGHRESVSLTGPPDSSGQKNPLQQIKSTVTYLRKTTFEAVTGIASSDDVGDDDGAGATEYITEQQISTILDFINSKGVDTAKFLLYMGAESLEKIIATDYDKAIAALKLAKGGKKEAAQDESPRA